MKSRVIPGVILAGGNSRRFGSDKREAHYQGRRLVEHATDCIGRVVSKVYYSVQQPDAAPASGWPAPGMASPDGEIVDLIPDAGPLAGIHAALTSLGSQYVLFLPVDLPRVTTRTLEKLVEGSEEASISVAVGEKSGRLQPLLGVYGKDVAPLMERRLKRGMRSAVSFIEELERLVPELYVLRIKIPDSELHNVNLVSDLDLESDPD